MRVLILVQNEPLPQDRHVWNQCRALTGAGYDVTVICPQGATRHQEPYERLAGVDIHRYRARHADGGIAGYGVEYASALWSMGRLAWRLAKKRPFDVVHACSPPDFLLLSVLPLRRHGTRFIFDHHDLTPELFASRFGGRGGLVHRTTLVAEQVAFRLADVVLSVNDSYRRVALTRGRRRPEDVYVVRTGPDLTRFAPTAPDPALKRGKPFLLSYVGVMGPQDGVDHAIRALAVLHERRRGLARGVHGRRRDARRDARARGPSSGSATPSSSPAGSSTTRSAACCRPPTSASPPTRRTRSTTSRRW